jgi:predicted transcriptional regulator of viral defense system
MTIARTVSTTTGIELTRKLMEQGCRIFTTQQAQKTAPSVGIAKTYLNEALYHLIQSGWLTRIHKGLYALSSATPGVAPVHEFEIAMNIVSPAAISHWSALHYHGLTEQIPHQVFVLTTTTATIPRNTKLGEITYQCIRVKPERYFGTQKIWIGNTHITITDPERTLLDGLMKPQYFGDFAEILHAFELHMPKIKLDRIIDYALKLDTVVAKRLGWILEHHGIISSKLEKLAALSITGYRPLDPTRSKKGNCDRRWSIQENLRGKINK